MSGPCRRELDGGVFAVAGWAEAGPPTSDVGWLPGDEPADYLVKLKVVGDWPLGHRSERSRSYEARSAMPPYPPCRHLPTVHRPGSIPPQSRQRGRYQPSPIREVDGEALGRYEITGYEFTDVAALVITLVRTLFWERADDGRAGASGLTWSLEHRQWLTE